MNIGPLLNLLQMSLWLTPQRKRCSLYSLEPCLGLPNQFHSPVHCREVLQEAHQRSALEESLIIPVSSCPFHVEKMFRHGPGQLAVAVLA